MDRKQSTMTMVEGDNDMYVCLNNTDQIMLGYYKDFTSTVGTINANGGKQVYIQQCI